MSGLMSGLMGGLISRPVARGGYAAGSTRDVVRAVSGHAAVLLDDDPTDGSALSALRADTTIEVIDRRSDLRRELSRLRPALTEGESSEPDQWAYFPWRRSVVAIPGPQAARRLRLDRNRNKITMAEQDRLGELVIGIVGLSVGHAIAHALALEGLCGRLRLADFDSIEMSNLNRIPATVLDLGLNKAVVVARRIAELDPYLPVEVFPAGVDEYSTEAFFDGLDLVIEECDSLDMKLRIRHEAKLRGIPVLMETSDRGLFDVERFDHEPDRPLFHGLLGDVDPSSLHGLSTRDKAPHVMRILQTGDISARMAASMVEIDRTVSTWPQLGGDVQLGAATVAAAVRRFGLGEPLRSGRVRVDLENALDGLGAPVSASIAESASAATAVASAVDSVPAPALASDVISAAQSHHGAAGYTGAEDAARGGREAQRTPVSVTSPIAELLWAMQLAPSGGNSQPWHLTPHSGGIDIRIAKQRSSAMDVAFRGSYLSIGAAAFNARVVAAHQGLSAWVSPFPCGPDFDMVATVAVSAAPGERIPGETVPDADLAELHPAMMARATNRHPGRRRSLDPAVSGALQADAAAEGARLRLITDPDQMAAVAELIAESDRIRYLTPHLHRELMSELRWPGRDRTDAGIDIRTLAMDATDLAKLEVVARADVMARLADWDAGIALGDHTRERVAASSALALVTMSVDEPASYVRGGMAVERIWVRAEQHGLGVQPLSPVFLYARSAEEREELSPEFSDRLHSLSRRFAALLGLFAGEAPMLLLRLSHDVPAPFRSERLTAVEVLACGPAGPGDRPTALAPTALPDIPVVPLPVVAAHTAVTPPDLVFDASPIHSGSTASGHLIDGHTEDGSS